MSEPMIDQVRGSAQAESCVDGTVAAMDTGVQASQAARSPAEATIEINGVVATCRADEWVRFGDWLVKEHGVRAARITTPFAVTTRAEQDDAEGPEGHVFAFMTGDPEDEFSDGDRFGAWVVPGDDPAHIVANILARRWPHVSFELAAPAGVVN